MGIVRATTAIICCTTLAALGASLQLELGHRIRRPAILAFRFPTIDELASHIDELLDGNAHRSDDAPPAELGASAESGYTPSPTQQPGIGAVQIHDRIAAMEEPSFEDVDMSDPEQAAIWKTVQILLNKIIYADSYLEQETVA